MIILLFLKFFTDIVLIRDICGLFVAFDPIEYLTNLQHFGVKLGLERMHELVALLGHPENKFPSIHVAGTNGKGSTCAMLASVLQSEGYKVGLYTSPHLEIFNERIQINGIVISDNELLDLVVEIREQLGDEETTFFEFTTAIALLYFARSNVDIAVIEVGLGGRLDATNVITPIVSVITTIDYDHTKILGETLPEIALEKAGIVKKEVPLVCGESRPELVELFRKVANEHNCEMFESETKYNLLESNLFGQKFQVCDINYQINLLGEHQIQNALIVLKTVDVLRLKGIEVSEAALQTGLVEAKWLGRLQIYSDQPLILFDGAHNIAGMKTLSNFLSKYNKELFDINNNKRKSVCIVGISTGKDVKLMLQTLSNFFDKIIIVQATHRAISKEEVALIAVDLFLDVEICEINDALEIAKETVGNNGFILVSGSLYVVGDVLKSINQRVDGLKLRGAIANV